jgi:hypothetical protein
MHPITTADDLRRLWQALLAPADVCRRSLWLLVIDGDGRPLPAVPRFDDIPLHPARSMLGNLMVLARRLPSAEGLDLPGASIAFLLARPGPAVPSPSDRSWARGLECHVAKAGLRSHPLALAGDGDVILLGGDEEAAAA